ncbi:DNA polymerase III, alpha subunit [Brevibacterium sandarakinum]|uniref:DNA polymerase III subunit alpha n=1 Tax=Brevibacterium sandarakinum TaxID=629680 RepID=A0A1H1X7N0_BRESA|nr:DNA polymerase III subunit alpha [Brevibacterium sandarakinum]SDT05120.1 DNA polymerase III, alpha subunit [Brevibacterium sandarakinum]
MPTEEFVHLHVHSEYSMLDGAAHIGPLVDEAARQGMPAVAVTDHGNVFGAFEFWRTAKDAGIKPIIGTEAYLTPGTHRSERTRVRWGDGSRDDVSGAGAYTHLTMLAETTGGMHNLFRLSSLASMEGQYFKPRMDRELLSTYGRGLIATTGCPSSEVQTRLRLGQYDEARQAAADFRDIFGAENYFCELMDHGLGIEKRVMGDLIRIAKDLGLPLVATNDLHYVAADDAKSHAALLCVQSGSTMDDPKRFKFDADEFYLKSAAQMRHLFRDFAEACDNTLLIAERCNVEFDTSANYMPRFPVRDGETEETWLVKEIERGLNMRYPGGISQEVRERAEYETAIILQMGFAGYFLVVADFIQWAKSQGIRVGPGRGSGAGSMVAYALTITGLDPLVHDLIFERFLNPDRVSMPDFDVDFDDRRRGEVIQYVTDKYGDDRVAQIVTYGTIKAKQALKDSARVLGHPFSMGEKVTKAMPPTVSGKDIPLSGIFDSEHPRYAEAQDVRALIESDPEVRTVYDTATGLENLKRQWGVHAAGVIMSSEPLMDVIPLMKRDQDGQIITQFDYPTCEGLGLIKMDFLGLRNLTIISDALDNIRTNRGEEIDLEELPLNDAGVFELMRRGDTLGVIQFDGDAMRSLLRLARPDHFEDITAVGALYRPGPMGANSHINYALRKTGQQEIVPIHPELAEPLDEVLGKTYGLIVYQEQVMTIAQVLAGFTLGQADLLRRAMGKKKKAELDKQFEGFSSGMRTNGYSEEAITTLWNILLPFSDYAFNKAHSAAYGLLSYWTAYLKAHYPAEYMAALLTSVGENRDKMALYLGETRRMGIRVLPPDVNESIRYFAAVGEDIRFGLEAIRNVGGNVVEQIVRTRKERPFEEFHDFLRRVPQEATNKRAVESLIKAGAFDQYGHSRRALVSIHKEAVDATTSVKREEARGQYDLFAGIDGEGFDDVSAEIPTLPEWGRLEKLGHERDMLGLYVSDHPLTGLEQQLSKRSTHAIEQLLGEKPPKDGQRITVAGLITQVQQRVAKSSGNPYAIVRVEDLSADVTVMVMGKTHQLYSSALEQDVVVAVTGRVSVRDEGLNLHADGIEVLDAMIDRHDRPFTILIAEDATTEPRVTELGDILSRHPGETATHLKMRKPQSIVHFDLPNHPVSVTNDLYAEVKALLGANSIE